MTRPHSTGVSTGAACISSAHTRSSGEIDRTGYTHARPVPPTDQQTPSLGAAALGPRSEGHRTGAARSSTSSGGKLSPETETASPVGPSLIPGGADDPPRLDDRPSAPVTPSNDKSREPGPRRRPLHARGVAERRGNKGGQTCCENPKLRWEETPRREGTGGEASRRRRRRRLRLRQKKNGGWRRRQQRSGGI
jgi:hypothetical protein